MGLGALPRLPLPVEAPLWGARRVCRWCARADIGFRLSGGMDPQRLKEAALEAIRSKGPFEWTVYTDGTPGGNDHDSGAAAVLRKAPQTSLRGERY